MSVYVDDLFPVPREHGGDWRYGKACHLLADSTDELHRFAATLGLQRAWFQDGTLPHFDLTEGKRLDAINAGAVPIGRRQVVEMIRRRRTLVVGVA